MKLFIVDTLFSHHHVQNSLCLNSYYVELSDSDPERPKYAGDMLNIFG
jgi:hypothetical protein